jgi:hypothetical protein
MGRILLELREQNIVKRLKYEVTLYIKCPLEVD